VSELPLFNLLDQAAPKNAFAIAQFRFSVMLEREMVKRMAKTKLVASATHKHTHRKQIQS